jgi:hypothetical protein
LIHGWKNGGNAGKRVAAVVIVKAGEIVLAAMGMVVQVVIEGRSLLMRNHPINKFLRPGSSIRVFF